MKSLPVLRRLAATSLCLASFALPASAAVKGQYIAKAYTEALGRIPDQGGWLSAINSFASQGCNASSLRGFFRGVYLSTEFNNLGYDNAAKLLTLYRGVLNREPAITEFNNNLTLLGTGTSWTTMVDNFLNGSEFTNKVSTYCNTPNYGFGAGLPIALPVSGSGFTGTQAQLQATIDATPAGGTVFLAQKALVSLSSTLILKAGVTLATTGNPDPNHYANMGRLIRASHFPDAMIRLLPGSKLQSVWVDGQRSALGFSFESVNIQIWGGTGTTVTKSRMTNSAGGTNLKALGSGEGKVCGSNLITFNLIDAYTSSHTGSTWSDGLTIVCENTTIDSNQILDATDVAIVIFGALPAVQRSIAQNNIILNVGNSAYGGLVFDSWHDSGTNVDFTGATFRNNTIWSGPSVHYDVALSVGTRPWFGNTTNRAFGASMINNTSGISKINVDTGIAVSGMTSATVTGNTLDTTHVNSSSCPGVDVAVALTAGWGSGTIQTYVDTDVNRCVFH